MNESNVITTTRLVLKKIQEMALEELIAGQLVSEIKARQHEACGLSEMLGDLFFPTQAFWNLPSSSKDPVQKVLDTVCIKLHEKGYKIDLVGNLYQCATGSAAYYELVRDTKLQDFYLVSTGVLWVVQSISRVCQPLSPS